ncbi:hypothetical protein ACM66B_002346 [Microbotryomycetes sp. NB124-2]
MSARLVKQLNLATRVIIAAAAWTIAVELREVQCRLGQNTKDQQYLSRRIQNELECRRLETAELKDAIAELERHVVQDHLESPTE